MLSVFFPGTELGRFLPVSLWFIHLLVVRETIYTAALKLIDRRRGKGCSYLTGTRLTFQYYKELGKGGVMFYS